MQFVVKRDVLLRSLNFVQGIVEKKNTLPILSNVLLELKNDSLSIVATDLDIIFYDKITDVKILTEGSTTTSAAILYDILRKISSNADLNFELISNNKLSLKSENSNFNLLCLTTDNFPSFSNDFDTPDAYSYFRYIVTSVVSGSMHQINELEFFGTESTSSSSSTTDPTTDSVVVGGIDAEFKEVNKFISQSTSMISSRLSNLRKNRLNENLSTKNIKLDFGNPAINNLISNISTNDSLSLENALSKITPNNWSSWTEGTISMTKLGSTNTSSSKKIGIGSLAIGYDKKLNDNDIVGFAVQYSESLTRVGVDGKDIESQNYNISIYRTKPLDDNNFIEGLIGIGRIESDFKRRSGSYTGTGYRKGDQIFSSINFGKKVIIEESEIIPLARINLGQTLFDSYTESGTNGLSFGEQKVYTGSASLGLEARNNIKLIGGELEPFGVFEYELDFSKSPGVEMNYVTDTSTIYSISGFNSSSSILIGELGLNYEILNKLNILTSIKRKENNQQEHSNEIKFGLNVISKRDTEYAFLINRKEDLNLNLNMEKKIKGFDINIDANHELNNHYQQINLKLSKKY